MPSLAREAGTKRAAVVERDHAGPRGEAEEIGILEVRAARPSNEGLER